MSSSSFCILIVVAANFTQLERPKNAKDEVKRPEIERDYLNKHLLVPQKKKEEKKREHHRSAGVKRLEKNQVVII